MLTTVIYGNVNCGSFYIQNSNRLTVTVYSPSRELTVVLCFVRNGWFFVELPSLKVPSLIGREGFVRFVAGVTFPALFVPNLRRHKVFIRPNGWLLTRDPRGDQAFFGPHVLH